MKDLRKDLPELSSWPEVGYPLLILKIKNRLLVAVREGPIQLPQLCGYSIITPRKCSLRRARPVRTG